MIVIILLLLLFGIKQQIDINSLNSEKHELEKKLKEARYETEIVENEANKSQEEYIEGIASDLGLIDPNVENYYGA